MSKESTKESGRKQMLVFDVGQSVQVSSSCNPNFTDFFNFYGCERMAELGWCNIKVSSIVSEGIWNTDGLLETPLQCPECGCGSEGALNLNDLWAAEKDGSRKVSDVSVLNKPF